MAHLQYMPGDPRLVDQLVCELKSKGIFDQFRKECIADVDTRPAYQNLRQRVESSVSTFLSRQCWKPDLNKNQLREKLRKHILDGNYLEQGVERIVDQVVNPKVASVFIPQVEDLVYNYLGITRKKNTVENAEKAVELLPTDLEAVSPGSVKSNEDKDDTKMHTEDSTDKMDVDKENIQETKDFNGEKKETENTVMEAHSNESDGSMGKCTIPLPSEDINLENIPAPENSPPKPGAVELEKIALPKEPVPSASIPLPEDPEQKEANLKMLLNSDDSNSSSNSSIRRNMSPLTPIRNFNNENSCDAQQAFDNETETKDDEKTEPSSFRFTIESKEPKDKSPKPDKKQPETDLAYQFNNQVNLNVFNTPMYDDSSNSNNLRIDYESDTNSKAPTDNKPETDNAEDSKKEKRSDDKKSHKSSHRSRDSSRHSSSKDKRYDSKHSRDSSRHDKKSSSSKDDKKSSKDSRDRSKDRSDKKETRESSKHRSSSSTKSSSHRDSKSHRSSSSSHKRSSKSTDEKKSSSSSHRDKEKSESKDKSSKDKSKDSRSGSHRSEKDRKSSSSKKPDEKDKKKDKKDTDDHYSSSGRGNHSRRSTDRDSNDGSSSSKGTHNQNGSKTTENKKSSKNSSSKSDNTSTTSGDSTCPSDKDQKLQDNTKATQFKPAVRVDNHLETPIAKPPRLPFVPDITLKKPKFAANMEEAKKMMKLRKFLDDEQKRMNQEAALLLEFQANVRPSLSQVYSSIPGPELEFACGAKTIVNPPLVAQPMEEVTSTENKADNSNESMSDSKEIIQPEPESVEQIYNIIIGDPENEEANKDLKVDITYDENKPFSQLVEEISKYSKASENKAKMEKSNEQSEIVKSNSDTNRTEYFEVTIITENFSESENEEKPEMEEAHEDTYKLNTEQTNVEDIEDMSNKIEITEQQEVEKLQTEAKPVEKEEITLNTDKLNEKEEIQVTNKPIKTDENVDTSAAIEVKEKEANKENQDEENKEDTENASVKIELVAQNVEKEAESRIIEQAENNELKDNVANEATKVVKEKQKSNELKYFTDVEKSIAEKHLEDFTQFFKKYSQITNKMYLINCDTYEENLIKEVSTNFGEFEIVNYFKNGHLKLPNTTKNIVKNIALSTEVILPIENSGYGLKSPLFSPSKSECSFELSSDYDAKLEEIVNKKSRQEVMEIILGGSIEESSVSQIENNDIEKNLKRKNEVESSSNNNRSVLTPTKVRKMSESDQISSTTEELEEQLSNNIKVQIATRSKYLGKAKRVGLPRPKRCNIVNSPSSDKSVENYSQNTQISTPVNGKMKHTPRSKVQRYDTSDLYKPKLHYLSRRNNIS